MVLSSEAKIPEIKKPKEILVEIHAASVNPIDVLMRGNGYMCFKVTYHYIIPRIVI